MLEGSIKDARTDDLHPGDPRKDERTDRAARDRFLAAALSISGRCRLHQGAGREAVVLLQESLVLADRLGDPKERIAGLHNLHEAHRWLGEGDEAAAVAERLGQALEAAGEPGRAAWARRRAARVRAGEPLNRVVVDVGDKQLELDELAAPLPEGKMRFRFERNRLALGAVTALVDEGVRLGGAGDDAGALKAFQSAAKLDPADPRPAYFTGLAALGLRRYGEAVESYEQTERLAPGWYHCRADRALAAELAAGRITHEVFEAVRRIEEAASAADKADQAGKALGETPHLPILYFLKANALVELGSLSEAEAAARAGLDRDPDPDVRTRLLIALARATKAPDSRKLLEEAVALDGNRIASAKARVMLLSASS
jgi:tetratricopeptide (TPR) repeat protein